MGRFRSFLRRAARPAAMVAVVGTVSMSLIVTTPSTAQALTARDVKAAETFVMGAAKTIAPAANVAAAAATVTPVGMVLRLAQLGFLAYSTQDIWMPFIAGAWGAATDSGAPTDTAAGAAAVINPRLSIGNVTKLSNGRQASFKLDHAGMEPTSGTYRVEFTIFCKDASGAALPAQYDNMYGTIAANGAAWSGTYNTNYCATGHTLSAVVIGAAKAHPNLYQGTRAEKGPKNVLTLGSLPGAPPSDPGFDPYGADVKYKVRSECIAADGTKSTVEAESSGDYMKFPSCEAAGKGHGTGKNSVVGLAPGTTTEKPLWDSPAAPSDPATPLCDASRPTGGCVLSVELDGKQCEAGNVECENWAEIQKNDPNNTRLKCRFGPYTLPMASCAALERAYRLGGAPATKENTDGDPDTSSFQTPQNTPLANKAPAPTTTGTVPGSSGQPAPAPSGSPDAKMANCFPTGWAVFNPIEWVLKPLRCAFEPTSDLDQRTGELTQKATGKAPISFITNLSMTGPSGGGCPNWTINVGGMSENVVCESSFTAAILSVRAPLFGLVATAMVWPLLRSIWYAAIPVLRVTPSSGGK